MPTERLTDDPKASGIVLVGVVSVILLVVLVWIAQALYAAESRRLEHARVLDVSRVEDLAKTNDLVRAEYEQLAGLEAGAPVEIDETVQERMPLADAMTETLKDLAGRQ